jgi:tetrapyrrole methylase family protein/MazG family protein
MRGARVVDGRAFAIDAAGSTGPMLIAQCDSQLVCSEVKLALLDSLPPEHEVTVLQRLGLPDERVFTVALADVDRDVDADHLTSLFVDTGSVGVGPELARLLALTERLRGPGGCPWDAAQTHHTLRRHVLEEAYEVVEAIEQLPADAPAGDIPIGAYDALEDELGDLLFQVMIQSVLASEAGAFTVADVARAVHTKLVRRHPHVFGDTRVKDASEVVTNWEQIKKTEKDDQSLVAGVTAGLPALIATQKLFRKGVSVGLEPDVDVVDAVRRLAEADPADIEALLGMALAAVVAVGREHDIDAESALASWTRRYKDRFRRMEQLAHDAGIDLARAPTADVRALWEQAGA